MLLNLDSANNTILSCFFFLIIDLYFLIPAVVVQIFNPIADLVIPLGITIKEKKSRNWNTSSNCRSSNKKVLNIIKSCTNVFLVFTHQVILINFFKK